MGIVEGIIIVLIIVLIYYVWDELVNKEAGETFASAAGLTAQEKKGTSESALSAVNDLLTGSSAENAIAHSIMKEAYSSVDDPNFGDEESKSLASNMLSNLPQDDTYNSYLISSQLDEGTLASHQQFVYDQHRLRSKGGTAAHHSIFTPTDPVPWVGLRRPDYTTASSDYNTRMGQEYSVRSSQLEQQRPNHIGI